MPYLVVHNPRGTTRFYHTHGTCRKLKGRQWRQVADVTGLKHCGFCATKDRKAKGAA